MMVQAKIGDTVVCEKTELANNFFKRFMGLMYRKSMDSNCGLLLTPCNEIHTFGMRFPIDVVYLSKDNQVLKIEEAVLPHKICKTVKNCHSVLELNKNIANINNIQVGNTIVFK